MSTVASYVNVATGAQACGKPRFSQPFNGDNGAYVLEQDFQQNIVLSAFTPLALNTAHPTFATYFLVSEGALSDLTGGEVKWTRTYCAVPATRSDSSSMVYEFIGYAGLLYPLTTTGATVAPGRLPFTATVTVRMQNDYFLVGSGGSYATPDLIPTILGQRYYIPAGHWSGSTFIPTYASPTLQAKTGLQIQAIYDSSLTLPASPYAQNTTPQCVPSRTDYEGWITSATEIAVEDSQLSRWRGNIYQRVSKYILPI